MFADADRANVAAIRYHFGEKAGIYRTTIIEPMGQPKADIALFDQPTLSLEQALLGLSWDVVGQRLTQYALAWVHAQQQRGQTEGTPS
jgi:hypothetical protein